MRSGALRMYSVVNPRQIRPITECVALSCSLACLICTVMLHIHFIAPTGMDSCLGAYLRERTDLNNTDVLRVTVESEFTRFMDEFERRYNATYESERRRAVGEKRSRHHGSESKMQAQEEGNERQGFDQRDAGAAATGPEAASHDATHTAGTGVPIQMRTDYRRISPVGRAIVDALSPVAPSDVGEALGPRASGMAAHADPAASTGGAGLNEGPLFEEARAGEPQAGHSADPGERGSTDPAAPLGAQTGPEAEAQQSVLTEQEEEKVREVAMMMAVQEATEAMPVTDAILMGDVPDDEIYYYSRYHGFLELPRRLWPRHGVVVQNVTVPGNLSCFGPTPLKTLIELSLGFEAPVVSALGDLTGLKGFVHRKGSGESVALSATAPGHSVTDTAIERLAHRIGVLMASVILLIALSTIVSFLMQQLQVRAIRLMLAARIHARRRRPFTSVALTHFAESALLFVPIFFGIFTFLFEFFADQGLALASFVLVWMGQAFHVLCLSTTAGRQWFSRLLSVYVIALLTYAFTFPFGFTYPATLTTFAFTLHAAMVALHRCELPAWEAETNARRAAAAQAAATPQEATRPQGGDEGATRADPAVTEGPEGNDGGGGVDGVEIGSSSSSSSDGGASPDWVGGGSPSPGPGEQGNTGPGAASRVESQPAGEGPPPADTGGDASAARDTEGQSQTRRRHPGGGLEGAAGAASQGAAVSPLGGDLPFSVFRRRVVRSGRSERSSVTDSGPEPDPAPSRAAQEPEEVD